MGSLAQSFNNEAIFHLDRVTVDSNRSPFNIEAASSFANVDGADKQKTPGCIDMKSHYMTCSLFLLSLLFVVPARADSDGCYCTVRGYIAFELRSFKTPGLRAPHVLRLFRFEAGRGIYEAGEVPMEDFQAHSMTCTSNRIEISGFGRVYTRYTIDIAGESRTPRITGHIEDANRRFDPSKIGPAPAGQLGLSTARVVSLESFDADHSYQLVLSGSTKMVKGCSETDRKAELLQIDSRAIVSQRVLLYQDRQTECGE
jgi:hypothetical protein